MDAKKTLLTAAIAGLTLTTPVMAKDQGNTQVMCYGVNSCKGHGQCAGKVDACSGKNGCDAKVSCHGKNSCKGKGLVKLKKKDCLAKGGKVAMK